VRLARASAFAIGLVASILVPVGCAPREDPVRSELRARLARKEALSADEVGRVLDQVGAAMQGKRVQVVRGAERADLQGEDREVVLGMLTNRAGVFDEGLKATDGEQMRVFNAPGRSTNPEIEASRRLFIDVDSFLPRRFEFAYAFPSPEDYTLELRVD
jgi:hypothetical protein